MSEEKKSKEKKVELQVAESLQEDIGKGIARISSETMKELGIVSGDLIEIKGKSKTVVKAMRDFEKSGISLIRINGTIRFNANVSIGEKVEVVKTKALDAKSITLSPTQEGIRFSNDPTEYFHMKLLHKPLALAQKIVIDVFGTRLSYVVSKTSTKGNVFVTPVIKIIVSDEVSAVDLSFSGIS